MRVDGYIRVSQVRGRAGDSFISPDVQREQIENWAKLRRVHIDAWHVDLDQSGAREDRPGLVRALERIEAGESQGLVVAKLDRFARSLSAALEAIRRIDEAGGIFTSVHEGIDPTTSAGKMMQRLLLVLAEFELDRIRESWQIARRRAVERGVHIASRTPTGYVRRPDGVLEPHPEYAEVITELFRRRAAGGSWRELCRLLNDRGVVGPYGSPYWPTRAVTHIIDNRVYLGEARSGEFTKEGAHEPLVDRALWQAAQATREPPGSRGEPALLAGLLRCAGCRYLIKPDRMTIRFGERAGERVRSYRCRGEHAAGVCRDRAAALGTVIEPHVEAEFFRAVGDVSASATEGGDELERAERALAAAEAELDAYRDEQIVGALGRARYLDGLRKRAAEVERAEQAVGMVRARLGTGALPGTASLTALWPELEVREKQRLLGSVFDCVFLRSGRQLAIGERTLFVPRGEAPDDLPRRGKRFPLRPLAWPVD